MLDPQKLVIVSIFSTLILSLCLVFYRYIYPKRKISYFYLLLLISLLPLISVLRPGSYESGDFTLHIYEAMSFYDSIRDGNVIPRWGGELNATFGYPVFLFAYPLPNFIIVFFHIVGFSYVVSLKLFLIFAFIASGLSMFWLVRYLVNQRAAFLAALLYLFAPYHLVGLHFRVAIGEVLSFVFLPLSLLSTAILLKNPTKLLVMIGSGSMACLILSHQAVSLAFFPFQLLFAVIYAKNLKEKYKNFSYYVLSLFSGLGLSAFYWLPVIYEKQFTLTGLRPATVSFNTFSEFLFSPWRYGLLFQGPVGQLSVVIGYTQWAVIFLALYLLVKNKFTKSKKHLLLFLLIIFFLTFAMMQSFSAPVWNILPLINNFQFSYRLVALEIFIVAVVAGLISPKLSKYLFIALCILTIGYTGLNWGSRRMIPEIGDIYLRNNLAKSTFEGEGNGQSTPKWVDPKNIWFKDPPKEHLEITSGKASIKNILRENTKHHYIVEVTKDTAFKENTVYFPGWNVYANNRQLPINYNNGDGLIYFKLPKGIYEVRVEFIDTPVRILGKSISIVTLLLLIVSFVPKSLYRKMT